METGRQPVYIKHREQHIDGFMPILLLDNFFPCVSKSKLLVLVSSVPMPILPKRSYEYNLDFENRIGTVYRPTTATVAPKFISTSRINLSKR